MTMSLSLTTVSTSPSSVLSGLPMRQARQLALRSSRRLHELPECASELYDRITLSAGGMLLLTAVSGIWRLRSGCLRLAENGVEECRYLAWPGDTVGPEVLLGRWHRLYAVALLPVELEPVEPITSGRLDAQLLRQSWRQAEDMLALRSGSVADRLRYLHEKLESCPRAQHAKALPRLKDIALVIDATVETVCRTQAGMFRRAA